MKIAISITTIIFISFSFIFLYKVYDRIETLEMNQRVQKLLLQDTQTISGNWKKIALEATELSTSQKQRLDLQEDNINKALQLIRLQENHIKRLTK